MGYNTCMKIGDTLELFIDDIGSGGEGIAHHGEYTVFLPYALPGETVKAKVSYIKRNLVYGVLTHVQKPSENRVIPICPLFYRCGGCDLMHLDYKAQLDAKHKNLAAILRKNCGYTGEIAPVVPSPKELYYRNKIQLPFGMREGKAVLGFYKPGTHILVPLKKCFLHDEWADQLIATVTDFVNQNKLSVYDEASGKGLLRHLVARHIGGAMMVTLVINGDVLPGAESLASALKTRFVNLSLYLSVNTKRTNVILGGRILPVFAPRQTVMISGIKVKIHPMSFFQINDAIREKIYDAAAAALNVQSGATVIDAYSGIGLLGAILAKSGARIYNIEIVPEAIIDADKLYAANGLSSLSTNICGDAAEVLPKLIQELSGAPSLSVILDPPRKGCDAAVLHALAAAPVQKLIYISCNPATLSRDLALLFPAYKVESVIPYDMFPQTQHVECVVLMSRVDK
jgi:23S rRNA (uracil1939-C5)-methyltransferase